MNGLFPLSSAPVARLPAIAIVACALAACAPMSPMYSQDKLPESIKVPAGNSVAMQTVGVGEITYECRPKKDMAGQFEWVFIGPDAVLNDRNGMQVGKYFGPPATWRGAERRRQYSPSARESKSGQRQRRNDGDHLHTTRGYRRRHCTCDAMRRQQDRCKAKCALPG